MSGISISLPRSYDARQMFAFFKPRAIAGVEAAGDSVYARTGSFGGKHGVVSVTLDAKTMSVQFSGAESAMPLVEDRVQHLFNVSPEQPAAIRLFRNDKYLAKSFDANRGIRVPGVWDAFELGVRAILGQQVSVAGATTLAGRIAAKFGTPLKAKENRQMLFPSARELANAKLDGLGLTTRRAATINGFAQEVVARPSLLDTAKPLDVFVKDLVELEGFGPWTAQYMAMRLGYADAFPASDLGVRKALNMSPEKEVLKIAEAWRPYRATAVMYLWRSLA